MNNYSVLMSVYIKERPEFLEESILSVMNQTIKPNDFVLVCDGPLTEELDSTIESLCKKFSILNIVRLKENQGLGAALAEGIKYTKNNIVMRMDSDDICLSQRAEIELPLMDLYDVVGGYISEFEGDPENIIGIRKVPETYKDILKFMKKRNPFNHPTVMFKKDIVFKAGNYQTFMFLEDYYLWARLIKITNKLYNIQQVLVNMRSGVEMRARRSSRVARKSVKELRKYMYRTGLINWFSYIWYSFVYNFILILPAGIKKGIYKKLHKK